MHNYALLPIASIVLNINHPTITTAHHIIPVKPRYVAIYHSTRNTATTTITANIKNGKTINNAGIKSIKSSFLLFIVSGFFTFTE